jgi:hypothetical protein
MKSLRVYEGLEQHHRMAEALLPVIGQPFPAQRQDPRGHIGNMVVRKNEETAVIAQQVQSIILMAEVPTDPTVTCRTFPGRGGKAQKSNPFITPRGEIPKGLADLGQETQVMMPLHLFLIPWLFKGTNRAHNDFVQVQDAQLPDEVDEMRRSQPFIPHPEGFVQD